MKGKLYRSLFRDEFSELVSFLSSFEKRRGGGEKGTKYRTSFSNSISIKGDCFKLINDNFQLYSRNKKKGKIEQKRNFGNFGNFGLVDKRVRMNNIPVSRCQRMEQKEEIGEIVLLLFPLFLPPLFEIMLLVSLLLFYRAKKDVGGIYFS